MLACLHWYIRMADDKQWYNKQQPAGNGPKPSGKRPDGKNAARKRAIGKKTPGKKPAPGMPFGSKPQKPAQIAGKSSARPMPGAGARPSGAVKGKPQGRPQGKPSAGKRPQAVPVSPKSKEDIKRLKAQKKAAKEKKLALENERKLKKEQAKIENKSAVKKGKGTAHKSAKSRALRNGFLGTVTVIAGLLVLAFVIHHLYDYIAEKPVFSFVTTGTVEHTIGAKALIVRDETVITSTTGGELVTSITEGSRVAKQQELAIVVPADMQGVVSDLRNVQSQISDVQQEIITAGGVSEAETIYSNYNKNLSAIIDSVRFDSMTGNLSNQASYSSSINVILDEREDELSNIDFDDERISVLTDDEKVYENQLEAGASKIFADHPGIASFRLDGLEEILVYDSFLTMDIGEVKNYINSSSGAITSDLSIEAGEPVVRLAQNESQYLTVYLSADDAAITDFAVGTLHDINVRSEGLAIDNCEVVRCESDAGGMLITFKTTRCVEDLLDMRTVDIEIVISETNGMRVSSSSLVGAVYAPEGTPAFCLYFASDSGVSADAFAEGSIFNISVVPETKVDETTGEIIEQENTTVSACTVIHAESTSDGGVIVAFSTMSEYKNLFKLSKLYTEGYTLTLVDTSTGLGSTVTSVECTNYSGIATIYVNTQGFVEEYRVIVTDHDREFAIIEPVGDSKIPNSKTVIISNPETVAPGDKVG